MFKLYRNGVDVNVFTGGYFDCVSLLVTVFRIRDEVSDTGSLKLRIAVCLALDLELVACLESSFAERVGVLRSACEFELVNRHRLTLLSNYFDRLRIVVDLIGGESCGRNKLEVNGLSRDNSLFDNFAADRALENFKAVLVSGRLFYEFPFSSGSMRKLFKILGVLVVTSGASVGYGTCYLTGGVYSCDLNIVVVESVYVIGNVRVARIARAYVSRVTLFRASRRSYCRYVVMVERIDRLRLSGEFLIADRAVYDFVVRACFRAGRGNFVFTNRRAGCMAGSSYRLRLSGDLGAALCAVYDFVVRAVNRAGLGNFVFTNSRAGSMRNLLNYSVGESDLVVAFGVGEVFLTSCAVPVSGVALFRAGRIFCFMRRHAVTERIDVIGLRVLSVSRAYVIDVSELRAGRLRSRNFLPIVIDEGAGFGLFLVTSGALIVDSAVLTAVAGRSLFYPVVIEGIDLLIFSGKFGFAHRAVYDFVVRTFCRAACGNFVFTDRRAGFMAGRGDNGVGESYLVVAVSVGEVLLASRAVPVSAVARFRAGRIFCFMRRHIVSESLDSYVTDYLSALVRALDVIAAVFRAGSFNDVYVLRRLVLASDNGELALNEVVSDVFARNVRAVVRSVYDADVILALSKVRRVERDLVERAVFDGYVLGSARVLVVSNGDELTFSVDTRGGKVAFERLIFLRYRGKGLVSEVLAFVLVSGIELESAFGEYVADLISCVRSVFGINDASLNSPDTGVIVHLYFESRALGTLLDFSAGDLDRGLRVIRLVSLLRNVQKRDLAVCRNDSSALTGVRTRALAFAVESVSVDLKRKLRETFRILGGVILELVRYKSAVVGVVNEYVIVVKVADAVDQRTGAFLAAGKDRLCVEAEIYEEVAEDFIDPGRVLLVAFLKFTRFEDRFASCYALLFEARRIYHDDLHRREAVVVVAQINSYGDFIGRFNVKRGVLDPDVHGVGRRVRSRRRRGYREHRDN